MYNCNRFPSQTSTPRHFYTPSGKKKKNTEYSTSHFVLLHLNCKMRGLGWVGNRNKNLPSLHWIWLSVDPHRNQREELNCIFFLFSFEAASMTAKRSCPSLPNFYKSSSPHQSGSWGKISARSSLIVLLLLLWLVCDGGSICCAALGMVKSTGAKLVDPVGIDSIDPALVKVDEENHICRKANWG